MHIKWRRDDTYAYLLVDVYVAYANVASRKSWEYDHGCVGYNPRLCRWVVRSPRVTHTEVVAATKQGAMDALSRWIEDGINF